MGLISGRVQKVMKIGILVQEVLRQQSQASAGVAEHLFAAGSCANWTPGAKFLVAVRGYGPGAGGWHPGISFLVV